MTSANNRPDVSVTLCLETSAASDAMLAEVQGLYLVPLELDWDCFPIPSAPHTEFVAEVNLDFDRIDTGAGS